MRWKENGMSFDDFFRALWPEKSPFPWQTALARWIEEKGRWPETISVPTSAGKTAVIDIAIYALACGWTAAATRIFFVVDRRLVVDEARDRADAIREAIEKNADLEPIRGALRGRCSSDQFLHVSTMRGGMPLETAWAKSPIQPTVCLTTVDQLGSRLLFRGYGVSPKMAPIHAGLAGTDSLIILDEAHLSEPFRQTLTHLKGYRSEKWCTETVGKGLQVTSMSATLHSGTRSNATHFEFQESYLPDESPSEVLRQRLSAPKLTTLITVGDASDSLWKRPPQSNKSELYRWRKQEPQRLAALESKCAELARETLTFADSPKVIGVILNRVNSARSVFRQLRKWNADNGDTADVILLTGRSRPIEREALVAKYWEHIRAGRTRDASNRPVFVVATQCIEAGVNLDFDALITELASLDALRQRFGRLDRFGDFQHARAWIVARADHARFGDEAIYGTAAMQTFSLLDNLAATGSERTLANEKLAAKARLDRAKEQGKRLKEDAASQARLLRDKGEKQAVKDTAKARALALVETAKAENQLALQGIAHAGDCIDLGISAFELPSNLACYVPAPKRAPTLMPAHLDFFAQTNPHPAPDPDPAIFLHGPQTEPEGISIIWRADLSEHMDGWGETLSLLPPTSAEALSLPIYAAKQWLAGKTIAGIVDLEGTSVSEKDSRPSGQLRHHGLIWRGKKKKPVLLEDEDDLAHLKPGSVLVVGVSAGGVDEFGWNPESYAPARDLADIALSRQRARPTLRLHSALVSSWLNPEQEPEPEAQAELARTVHEALPAADDDLATGADSGKIQRALTLIQESGLLRREIRDIAAAAKAASKHYPDGSGRICLGCKDKSKAPVFLWEDEDSSLEEEQRTLEAHAGDVATVLDRWLEQIALPPDIEPTLAAFPPLHDIGKADPRFQDFLCGGPVESDGQPLRAKSGEGELTRAEIRERWKECGLPDGWRHELCSLDLLEANPSLLDRVPEARRPLLFHLIGTHHGFGRILPPAIDNAGAPVFERELSGQLCRVATRHDRHPLDSGWIDQFAALQRQFGWHGLAWLEAIVRLADHVASARSE
jgi:CRISPR-associated endonuclease/helicase Cas3